ncbi:MAG: oligosaccharide flippase family protein, partial [Clostridia bacterium]|nr:oligosaccharide flippase family protein [Clostridia bacterium]
MLIKNKIIRDTVFLTLIQLLLDSSALLLNIFITHRLGASAIGILSLTSSFMVLIGMISNGNAFLCISRLVSEEHGKSNGNPNKILLYGILMCAFLSVICGTFIFSFSERISMSFFRNNAMQKPIKLLAAALPIGAFSACFKGFFNAGRTVKITAFADIIEFIVKAAVI